MELSRRHALGLLGLGTATVALSGCAGSGGGSSSGGQEASGPLQFWSNHPASSKSLEQKLIDAWNSANPDTPAELIDGGADYEEVAQKVNAALAGGDLPDVFVASDVNWFNFALNEAVTPLDDLWQKAGIDSSTYVDTLREDYNFNDKHYCAPYARSTCIMYFNKDMMQKAGLPLDRGPRTWDEFAQWAPQLVKANGGKPALILPDGANYMDWYFQGMIWTFGGAYSRDWTATFTEENSIKAGEYLKKHVAEGHIKIVQDGANDFGIGNGAALLESTGSLGGLKEAAKFDFYTTYLPGPKPGCATGGAGLAIPNGISDERKLTAAKFIDFMTNTDNTITFTQATGYMPVRKDAMEKPEEKKFLEENPNAMTAIKQLNENTQPQDAARVFVSGGGQRIGGGLDRITFGGEDVKTVFQQLQDETQKIIDSDIKPKL